MLKQGFLTTLFALLFAITPAIADDSMDEHKGAKHPAHEMGDKSKSDCHKKDMDVSEEYKDNLEKAKDSEGGKHPAHKMDEGEEMLDERGQ